MVRPRSRFYSSTSAHTKFAAIGIKFMSHLKIFETYFTWTLARRSALMTPTNFGKFISPCSYEDSVQIAVA